MMVFGVVGVSKSLCVCGKEEYEEMHKYIICGICKYDQVDNDVWCCV